MIAGASHKLSIEALKRKHDRSAFSCGSQALDRYLQHQARQDADNYVAAPFMLVEPPANKVLGYYTLSASVVSVDALPEKLATKLPRYPQPTNGSWMRPSMPRWACQARREDAAHCCAQGRTTPHGASSGV